MVDADPPPSGCLPSTSCARGCLYSTPTNHPSQLLTPYSWKNSVNPAHRSLAPLSSQALPITFLFQHLAQVGQTDRDVDRYADVEIDTEDRVSFTKCPAEKKQGAAE